MMERDRCVAIVLLSGLLSAGAARAQGFADRYLDGNLLGMPAATTDGGWLAVGTVEVPWYRHAALLKLDALGRPEWASAIAVPGLQEVFAVAEVSDGYVVVGRHDDIPILEPDGLIAKVDRAGGIAWCRTDSVSVECNWWSATTTTDGDVVMMGSGCSEDPALDLTIMKLDAAGTQQWTTGCSRRLPSNPGLFGDAGELAATADGGVIVADKVLREPLAPASDNMDALLMKLDANGIVEWQHGYGALYPLRERFSALLVASDSTIVAAGVQWAAGGSFTPFIMRSASGGELLWFRILDSGGVASSPIGLSERPDGSYLLAMRGVDATTLSAVSASGDVIWHEVMDGELFDNAVGADGGMFMTGLGGLAAFFDANGHAGSACVSPAAGTLSYANGAIEGWSMTRASGPVTHLLALKAASLITLPTTHDCPSCAPLACTGLRADPSGPCSSGPFRLHVDISGGDSPVADWDVNGDGAADAVGNDIDVNLPLGVSTISVHVQDACPYGVQDCHLAMDVDVPESAPIPEVSDVVAGHPPLRLSASPERLSVECVPGAATYAAYVGAIGRFLEPIPSAGACDLQPVDLGGGRCSLDIHPDADTWIVVTARDACSEGSAGRTSLGLERSADPGWTSCP